MADKYRGGIAAGAVNVETTVLLRTTGSNLGTTGVLFGAVTASYRRHGANPVDITLKAGSAADAAHDDGAWFEIEATKHKGIYRMDIPDAAFAAGATGVVVSVSVAGSYAFHREFAISDPMNDPIPASVVSGTVGEAMEAIRNVELGKWAVIQDPSGSGIYFFVVYTVDNDAVEYKRWSIDHPSAASQRVPA